MKTLALKHLHLSNVGASSKPPDGACAVHHGTHEVLIEQDSVPDGQANPPVQVRT